MQEIQDFFDGDVTHLITDVPIPTNVNPDKENIQRPKQVAKNSAVLKSPIKLAGG